MLLPRAAGAPSLPVPQALEQKTSLLLFNQKVCAGLVPGMNSWKKSEVRKLGNQK